MERKRKYNGKDAEMLIVASTITEAAKNNLAALVAKRANWADPFFPNHATRINNAINNILGVDSALSLRTQTAAVNAIVGPAMQNLTDVKIMIEQDFKSNKPRLNEILTTLGFNAHWASATSADQEGLMELLLQFKTNLTPALRTELEAKGISGTLLTAITDAAQDLIDANITQETLKQSRKAITETALTELNEIYDETISIGIISQRIFKDSPALKDQFNYSKILKNLRGGGLTTLLNAEIVVGPDYPYIVESPRITASTVITATTVSNLVYACRNEEGCVSSGMDAYHLTPEVPNTIRKSDLIGFGNKLVFTNLSPGFATVTLKIQA